MVLGAFAAIAQNNIKRLMAYSSIGHVGYALIGLAAGSEEGLRGVLIYMAIYLVMNVGAFACILSMKVNDRMVENIDDLAGTAKSHPMMALGILIFMLSLAGIPPMAGFFGKFFIFLSAIEAKLYTVVTGHHLWVTFTPRQFCGQSDRPGRRHSFPSLPPWRSLRPWMLFCLTA